MGHSGQQPSPQHSFYSFGSDTTHNPSSNSEDYCAPTQQVVFSPQVLEKLAEGVHELYRQGMLARGEQSEPAALDYPDLPEDLKEQNRQNVRDIPTKLAQVGYIVVPGPTDGLSFEFPEETLEELARMEHERWIREKRATGWRYGPETNPQLKLSQNLVPWEDLPESEKEKDRDLVRGIPKVLALAGYRVVKRPA